MKIRFSLQHKLLIENLRSPHLDYHKVNRYLKSQLFFLMNVNWHSKKMIYWPTIIKTIASWPNNLPKNKMLTFY